MYSMDDMSNRSCWLLISISCNSFN